MAKWSLSRPEEHCNEGEVQVARYLKKLPDNWLVQWGFFYKDDRGVRREGDFLILAPFGGVIVLEVKGGTPRHFSPTGVWEGESRDNPLTQLDKQWISVVKSFKGTPAQAMYITKALGLPNVEADPDDDRYHGMDRADLLTGNEMQDLTLLGKAMMRLFQNCSRGGQVRPVSEEARDTFIDLYAHGVASSDVSAFVDHTEAVFRQQLVTQYRTLDMLSENRQLLVSGGSGTGKSWFAVEQVRRYVEEGKDVLVVAYNKAFSNVLRDQIERCCQYKEGGGSVTVKSHEEVAEFIIGRSVAELLKEAQQRGTSVSEFYDEELPSLALQKMSGQSPIVNARYDALVVDEAQDHDSVLKESDLLGWWTLYFGCLKEGASSPMALFYDEAQRGMFRKSGGFGKDAIAEQLSQPAFVRLARVKRYSSPVFAYLQSLRGKATERLVDAIGDGEGLPEGPSVLNATVGNEEVVKAVESTIRRWIEERLCIPQEVLILHARSEIKDSVFGELDTLAGYKVLTVTGSGVGIRVSSIHKAKGLDSKAVIVVGVPEILDAAGQDYDRNSLFMGASRARQLLAVFAVKGEK